MSHEDHHNMLIFLEISCNTRRGYLFISDVYHDVLGFSIYLYHSVLVLRHWNKTKDRKWRAEVLRSCSGGGLFLPRLMNKQTLSPHGGMRDL